MATMTLEIPDELIDQAEGLREQFQALLHQNQDPLVPTDAQIETELRRIVLVLSSQPTPEQILALQPAPQMQHRVEYLLERQKVLPLRQAEARELDRYLFVEHLVRLAKAHLSMQQ